MQPSFSISVDASRDLMHFTLAGFYTPADVACFQQARDEAHRLLLCAPGQHLTIVDIRDMKIQSQESVAAFQELLADARYHGRRIAMVVSASLARSQIKRAAAERGAEYFHSVDQAEAWLLDSVGAAA